MDTELLKAIKERRSVREFTADPVSEIDLVTLIEAGSWAPSIRNHQPWRFVIIANEMLRSLVSELTIYSTIVIGSQALIAVYLDTEESIDTIQDQQSIGAVVQNMLLAADAMELGAVWLGQVREKAEQLNAELGIPDRYNLAALLAIGYPAHRNQKSHRKSVGDLILKKIGG